MTLFSFSSCSAVAAARFNAALGHIAESFEDPRLTIAAVAHRQRISPRYLQHLLEVSGISFTARVNELRLQRAFTLLMEARDSANRISDIALQAGFSDISHFNRLFRSRFGDTPSAVRAEGHAARSATRATAGGQRQNVQSACVDVSSRMSALRGEADLA